MFLATLCAHSGHLNYELGASFNFPQREFNQYARLGTGIQLNVVGESLFKKHENLSLVSSVQFSRFGSKKWDTYENENSVSLRSTEKLLSFSLGPRYTFKDIYFVGFGVSQNLFYNRIKSNGKWIDTSVGECTYHETVWEDCEEDFIAGFFWDLSMSLIAESINFIGSEITGIFTSKNLFTGYKINAGVMLGKTHFEVAYHTMPSLKYPILTNDESDLLDFIDADYLSVNISYLFKK